MTETQTSHMDKNERAYELLCKLMNTAARDYVAIQDLGDEVQDYLLEIRR